MRARPSWPTARVAAAALLFAGCYPTDDLQAPEDKLQAGDLGFFVSQIGGTTAVHILGRAPGGWLVYAATTPDLTPGSTISGLPFLLDEDDDDYSISMMSVRRDQLWRDAGRVCQEEQQPETFLALQVEVTLADAPAGCPTGLTVRLSSDLFCPIVTGELKTPIIALSGTSSVSRTWKQVWAKLPPRPSPCTTVN